MSICRYRGSTIAIYNNPNLVNLGLNSLHSIQHGSVNVDYNRALCHLSSIDIDLLREKPKIRKTFYDNNDTCRK